MAVRKYAIVNGSLIQVSGPPENKAMLRDNIADICASRRAPGCQTDSTFFAGIGTLDKQFRDKRELSDIVKAAKSHGYNPTGNELYSVGLARFPGDPRAFISQGQGKQRVREIVTQDGTGCEGAVTVKARPIDKEPKDKYKLAPQIVKRHLREKLKNPENAKRGRRELVEQIIHEHGPRG